MEYEYWELTCPECATKIEVKTTIVRGFKDNEDVHCPECKVFIRNIRADMGFEITEVHPQVKKS